jgi:REP element-mobilizing transposase RayT
MSRHHVGCPTYVLMPDHIHLIWIGAQQSSNQLLANRLLRTHLKLPLQKQAYDHVIQEDERTGTLFADTCNYVRNNPARANLVEVAEEWPFQGAMVPGYPSLCQADSSVFWKCFHAYQRASEL